MRAKGLCTLRLPLPACLREGGVLLPPRRALENELLHAFQVAGLPICISNCGHCAASAVSAVVNCAC